MRQTIGAPLSEEVREALGIGPRLVLVTTATDHRQGRCAETIKGAGNFHSMKVSCTSCKP